MGPTATATKAVRQPVADTEKLTQMKIREEIPKHLFQQNTLRSFGYLARDLAQAFVTWWIMSTAVIPAVDAFAAKTGFLGLVVKFLVWNVFWFVQGLNWTGLWVLAHESGHQAFSPLRVVNDTVGFFLHSFLLVPYHSWRITHGNHHKHTNHMELDTVFVPEKRGPGTLKIDPAAEAFSESPIASVIGIITMVTLGWPLYLISNVTGQKYNRWTNHYDPASPLFRKADRADIMVSDVGIVLMTAALAYWGFVRATPYDVLCWYFIPYLWVNFWLVFITFLQHTDVRVPHYSPENWNFVRGALATVDRDFGWVINGWLHHINDSHVVHHLFSTMPHYNAIEVTRKYLPKILKLEAGSLHMKDDRPLWTMLWESWRYCRYVVPADGIAWFRQ